jgi:hypothetical protein
MLAAARTAVDVTGFGMGPPRGHGEHSVAPARPNNKGDTTKHRDIFGHRRRIDDIGGGPLLASIVGFYHYQTTTLDPLTTVDAFCVCG